MFTSIYDYTIETLTARFDAKPLDVPPEFTRKEGTLRGAPLVMTNIAFKTDRLRKVRVTYMDGGEHAQIMTTMAFPRFEYDLPIFGADMLSFRGVPHLIVIDHQVLFSDDPEYAERYIEPMAAVYHRYEHLPTRDRHLPAWTAEFFSPYTHYSRPTALDYLPDVLAVYREYWDTYLDRVEGAQPPPAHRQPHIYARQAAYCKNHIENEQAEGMLQKLFGEEWCAAFINRFLFDVHEEGVYR